MLQKTPSKFDCGGRSFQKGWALPAPDAPSSAHIFYMVPYNLATFGCEPNLNLLS